MPAVKIYRVSVTNNTSYVQWTDCSGYIPPAQLITSRLKSIVFEAQGTGITPGVDCSISKSSAATIEIIGDGASDCSGTGNSENLTTTTTAAPPIITTTTTTTVAPSTTLSLGYHATSAVTACAAGLGTYYVRNNNQFVNSTQLFTNSGLTAIAPNGYYSNGTNYAIVSYQGVLSDKASCTFATTTTAAPTTTTAAPTTTTAAPTTTTAAPTTTTAAPTTTTAAPTTTTAAPTTTTAAPTTTTAAPTTTTAAPTTTTVAPPTATLYVYAKDVGTNDIILYAGVNGAAGTTIYEEAVDGNMPSFTCGPIYTFTATLVPGDTVTFSTNLNCIMAGDDSSNCPSATGSGTIFTTAYMVAGANYVALGMNSAISP